MEYLINWYTLNFKEDNHNYCKLKNWYKEIQKIVTVDSKIFKPEYRMLTVPYFKGYNMTYCEINNNNISKILTFIGI